MKSRIMEAIIESPVEDRQKELLKDTLLALEYWYGRSNPDWDGTASPGSTIGMARSALNIQERIR